MGRRGLLAVGTGVGLLGGAATAAWYAFATSAGPPPPLSSTETVGRLTVGGRVRSFFAYVPANLRPGAPLLIAFHPSGQDGGEFRFTSGYQFDRLADRDGFAVAYPNGYRRHWNDCRAGARYEAKKLDVDDEGFTRALIDHFSTTHGIDATRVYAAGWSNGGQFALRLALRMPDRVAAVGVIAASLPEASNCDCAPKGVPVPVMFVNGTADPINPHGGGEVTLHGFASRGRVLSSRASAEYFVQLAGHAEPPRVSRGGPVTRSTWAEPGRPEVVLDVVEGGGHVVQQPVFRGPRFNGPHVDGVNTPEDLVAFFARQPGRG